jgi:O-antigen ligase
VLALASLALSRRLRHLLFAVAMAIGAVTAIVTSQGRAVIVCSIVVALAYGLLTATSRGRVTTLLGLAVAALVSVFVIQAIVGKAGSPALRYQGLTTSTLLQTTSKARGKSLADIPRTMARYPLGAGLATAGPASGAPGATALTGGVDAENQFSFMTLETGIAGMALIVAFTVMLFVLGLRRCRHERDREARVLLAAVIAPIGAMTVLYVPSALTATTPGGPYLWAAGGIVSYWLVARPASLRRARAPAPER